jgi:CheY-like chemotaxis protein
VGDWINTPFLMRYERCKMPKSTVNLLVVEDDAALRTSLSHILAAFGHRVRCAADGFSALSELRVEVPDMILSDLNMPGMSGFEFLSVVRRRFPTIKVVAMSSAFGMDGVPPGVAADVFYQKGSDLGSLLQMVEDTTSWERPQSHHGGHRAAPIWVENEPDGRGGACIMLTCPECLRAFPLYSVETPFPVHEIHCIHCNHAFAYAIVQPADAAMRGGPRLNQPIQPVVLTPAMGDSLPHT